MTLILTNCDKPWKQIKNYILTERVKDHAIDSLCFYDKGRLNVAIFFYDDRSIGLYVKAKPSVGDIKFILREFKKKILNTQGEWFCMCKKNVKSGNKLAKLAGFIQQDTLNSYNIYIW